MINETFTNWLTRRQNLTHVGRTHRRVRSYYIFIIMILIKSAFLKARRGGKEEAMGCVNPGSCLRTNREVKVGEDEGGARDKGRISIIAGSPPWGPHTAEIRTAAAACQQLGPETGLHLQC